MTELTNELKKVADVSADIRENVDYNALMEKQTILNMAISKLETEIKKAEVINPDAIAIDSVTIGTRVTVEEVKSGEQNTYSILGPWDADYEKRILSYRSPIGMVILGKKVGDVVDLKIGDQTRKLKILSIEKSDI